MAMPDPMATMATTERGLLMQRSLPSLDPTLTPLLILGTATTAMATDPTAMATMVTDTMATMERGLLMRTSLAPTLMLRLTPGTDTTATDTGHMDVDIMVLATVDTTWDKK